MLNKYTFIKNMYFKSVNGSVHVYLEVYILIILWRLLCTFASFTVICNQLEQHISWLLWNILLCPSHVADHRWTADQHLSRSEQQHSNIRAISGQLQRALFEQSVINQNFKHVWNPSNTLANINTRVTSG